MKRFKKKPKEHLKNPAQPWHTDECFSRSLYEQVEGDLDHFVGLMETPELADFVARAVNYYQSFAVEPTFPTKKRGATSLLGDNEVHVQHRWLWWGNWKDKEKG